MNEQRTNELAIRKAAVLIASLDARSADALLEKMSAERAQQVRNAVLQLDVVSPQEEEAVLAEFLSSGDAHAERSDPGVELDESLVKMLAASDADSPASRQDPPQPPHSHQPKSHQPHSDRHLESAEPEVAPFRFLHEATVESLAIHLEHERPQVIAVVVSHLPPRRAAKLIQCFAPRLQVEVLRRVAELDLAHPEVVRDLEQQLERLLSDDLRLARNRKAGLAAVTSILNAAGPDRAKMIANVFEHDRELARSADHEHGARHDQRPTPVSPNPRHATEWRASPVRPAVAAQQPQDGTIVAELNSGKPEETCERYVPIDRSLGTRAERSERTVVSSTTMKPQNADQPSEPSVPTVNAVPSESSDAAAESSAVASPSFDDLMQLSDQDLVILIRELPSDLLLLALVGASEAFVNRLFKPLPKRDVRKLKQRMQRLGPVRLSDIEEAQRRIAFRAGQLVASGHIQTVVMRRFAAAA